MYSDQISSTKTHRTHNFLLFFPIQKSNLPPIVAVSGHRYRKAAQKDLHRQKTKSGRWISRMQSDQCVPKK